jgi:CRP-like cAMP-binding protein
MFCIEHFIKTQYELPLARASKNVWETSDDDREEHAKMHEETLLKTRLFKDFTDRELSHIRFCVKFRVQDFEKNALLTQQGDAVTDVGFLLRGSLLSEKYHMDGRAQIIRTFSPGSVLNAEAAASSLGTAPTTITANRSGRIVWAPYDSLIRNENIPSNLRERLRDRLLEIIADDNIRLMYKSDVLSVRTVRGRIMAHLSIMSEKRGSRTINIGMNQEEFARYLCVDRSSLSQELNKLRRANVIDFRKKTYTLRFPRDSEDLNDFST